MPEKPFVPNQLDDVLSSFEAGMNAGIAPQLLARNQLGNAFNATMRGDFATNRPPFNLMVLNYNGNSDIQGVVEGGLYQGCAYYKDRYGNPYLVASFSGRIFLFTPNSFGFTVTEITIPGDLNSPTSPQAWIWQAEDFVICNDGQSNPFIYDGTTSRRATQGSGTIATVSGGPYTIPAQGSAVNVTTSAPYTGQFNILVAVYSNAATPAFIGYFQTLQSNTVAPTYTVQLTNQSGTNQTVPTGAQVLVPGSPGQTTFVGRNNNNPAHVPGNGGSVTFNLQNFIAANLYRVNQAQTLVDDQGHQMFGTPIAGASTLTVQNVQGQPGFDIVFGHIISTLGGQNIPPTSAYPVGVIAGGPYTFTPNQTATVQLQQPYTGPTNQLVTINGAQFNISAPASTPPASSVTLLNITAAPGGSIAASYTIRSVPELPPGRMGVYGLGRNWMALTDGRSFIASDLVGSSSGTPAYGKRDAVLRTQHNTLLAAGGAFVVPSDAGEIQAMQFVTILDASLGQGPLMVHTPDVVFSCQAPGTDDTTWQTTTNPILTEAYKPQGGLSQRSTINVNGDSMYRAVDGIRSLILARKDFDVWGNVPASFEVDPTLRQDDQSLLQFSSAINFDNRVLMTATPIQGPTGAYFTNIIALNLDPISSLRGKQPAIYDGIWNGLNVLNLVVGRFVNVDRAFAFTYNSDSGKNELHELLPSSTNQTADDSSNVIITDLEFPVLDFGDTGRPMRPLKRLVDGEIYVDELEGSPDPGDPESGCVEFEVYFRADFDPTWHLWRKFSISDSPPWQSRMGLGEPPPTTDPLVNRPWREGYVFQMRVRVSGHVIIKGARFRTVTMPEAAFAPIPKPCKSKPLPVRSFVSVQSPAFRPPTNYWKLDTFNAGVTPPSVGPISLSADAGRWSTESGGLISTNCFKAGSNATVQHSILSQPGDFNFSTLLTGFTFRYWVKVDNNGNLENLVVTNGVISGSSYSDEDWSVGSRFVNPVDHYGAQFQKTGNLVTIYADNVFPDDLVWHRCVVIYNAKNKSISWKMDNQATITTIEPAGFYFIAAGLAQLTIQGEGITGARHLNVCEVGLWQNILLTEAELLLDWNGGIGKTFP